MVEEVGKLKKLRIVTILWTSVREQSKGWLLGGGNVFRGLVF